MIVEDVMRPEPISVYRRDRVSEVKEQFRVHKAGLVPVVDESRRMVGIITERDLQPKRCEGSARMADLRAEDVMTRDVVTIIPGADLSEAAILLNHYGLEALPVVVGDRVVGIISRDVVSNCMREISGPCGAQPEPGLPRRIGSYDNPVAAA